MSISTVPELRWGILGCARITRSGLAPGIAASQSGSLRALASRDEARARAWAEEFGAPRAYGSYEALLADPEVQAVYVPLPNELHRPWVLAAADAGKHVLCEKPLALDAAEAQAMVDHCRSRGVLLMEGFMWRHQPRTAALRERIAQGAIGELRLVRTSFSFPIAAGDWRLDPARGGGALWDIGCYGLNAARLYAGAEPVAIRSLKRAGASGVDLTLTAQFAFPGGALGVIDCSFEQPFRCEYEVIGTSGAFRVPDAFLPPEEPLALQLSTGGDAGVESPRVLSFDGRSQYARMVDAFARSVGEGRLVEPAEDGLDQMKALEAIRAVAFEVG